MTSSDFFLLVLNNGYLFLGCMAFMSGVLYLSVRNIAPAGYLDALHFYWTFTFGTAYGVVLSLYTLGYVTDYLFFIIASYGFVFILSFRYFHKKRFSPFESLIKLLTTPRLSKGKLEFQLIFLLYVAITLLVINIVGFGMFADVNRFEQNRGFGAFVRVIDAFRLFVIAYLTLMAVNKYKINHKLTMNFIGIILFLVIIILVSAVVNGSKFALLEGIYAAILAMVIYGVRVRIKPSMLIIIFSVVFCFAIVTLSINLDKAGFDKTQGSVYVEGSPVVLERLGLRVLGNADKYYLSLPNEVIEHIDTDNLVVRFIAPLVGITRLSGFLGYNVGNYNVGRQLALYGDPNRETAGGPTSHFDLFSYKYFGPVFGYIWIIFTGFLLANIVLIGKKNKGNIFASAVLAAMWIRGLPVLLEPTVGLAYIFDILILFFMVKIMGRFMRSNVSSSSRNVNEFFE